jgi:hypothetical protein
LKSVSALSKKVTLPATKYKPITNTTTAYFGKMELNICDSRNLFNVFGTSFTSFIKYETIETHARAFLTLNILSLGTVTVVSS